MTIRQAVAMAAERLSAQSTASSDAVFEARCMVAHWSKHSLNTLRLHYGDEFQPISDLQKMLSQRESGRPLQYLLGSWEFYGLSFAVGEGVLIPRPETELLVDTALEALSAVPSPSVLDLCAGTGAVGIAIKSRRPDSLVTAVEWESPAFPYLLENIARHGNRVRPVKWDVTVPPVGWESVDCIVSNPPYIPTKEVEGLQREVLFEPATALDGGADGLQFYRAIFREWSRLLRTGGYLAVEIGHDQGAAVSTMLEESEFCRVRVLPDLDGHDRVVQGYRK